MSKWRSVVVLVGTAAGFAASLMLLQRVLGASSPWLGLLAMFYLLGLSKVAEPLFLLRMPRVLRAVRRSETDGTIYRRLLVPSYGKLLRGTPLRYLNTAVYLAPKRPDLTKLSRQAEAAEAAHFWAALIFTPYIGYVWLAGQRWEAGLFLLLQIFVNIYPILHLRVVRGRLDRLLQRRPLQSAVVRQLITEGLVGSAERPREIPWAAIVDDPEAPPARDLESVLAREWPDAVDRDRR